MRDAILAQVDRGDLRGLKSLGAKFASSGAAYSDDAILNAEYGSGIRAYRDQQTGKVVLSIPGHGTVWARDAIRHGIVKVAR